MQVTGVGEMGVFMVLFSLGLEVSVTRLRDMFRLAVVGGIAISCLVIAAVTLLGLALGRPLPET